MKAIALYDLDRTVTVAPTFTPFLVHMAARHGGWRLALLPVWVLAMLGYKLGLYGRDGLKRFGLWLMVGREVRNARLQPSIDAFVDQQITRNIRPGALEQIARDQASDVLLVLVTAAPEIYASAMADQLGFAVCIATRHKRSASGALLAEIDGRNNYGAEKVRRAQSWLQESGLDRVELFITAYTDHASDAPILDFADRGVLVGRFAKPSARWQQVDWGR